MHEIIHSLSVDSYSGGKSLDHGWINPSQSLDGDGGLGPIYDIHCSIGPGGGGPAKL